MIKYLPFELHCHTDHSDASFTAKDLVGYCKNMGHEGFALTDHNTISGHLETQNEAKKAGLLMLRGVECTTFYGHITVIGEASLTTDWRLYNRQSIMDIAKNIKKSGSLIGIAHPFRIGYPICTGGSDDWDLADDYSDFTHYEAYSAFLPHKEITNALALERYYRLCSMGNKLACVYGRDLHSSNGENVATATYLGIDGSLDEQSAIDAVRHRRTYISTNIRMHLELLADRVYNIGEEIESGEYLLKASLEIANKNIDMDIGTLRLFGDALEEEIRLNPCENGGVEAKLSLKRGLLKIEIEGSFLGEKAKLLIATPFFVKG